MEQALSRVQKSLQQPEPQPGAGPLLRLLCAGNRVIGRAANWFNSRRWFIRYLLNAEWVLVVTVIALITATSI
jgi:hypothetical protein